MFKMKCLLLSHIIFICYFAKFTSAISRINITTELDFTYELEQINGTCVGRHHSCKKSHASFETENEIIFRCLCHRPCANLRSCCFDSPYRNLVPTVQEPSCKWLKERQSSLAILVVEKCPDSTEFDIKRKCEIGWNKDDEDYFLLAPVVSLATNMTYRNYFCFRCNEDHDERVYWNIRLSANIDGKTVINDTNIVPVYSNTNQSWMAPFGENGTLIEVSFSIQPSLEIVDFTKPCFLNVISSCPENWEDDQIKYKCYNLYTLITMYINDDIVYYKNPYCALCNFEDLNEKECYSNRRKHPGSRKKFSFSLLLDFNESGGSYVGKIQKCADNQTWDPYYKKCRGIRCAQTGYIIHKGKCIKA